MDICYLCGHTMIDKKDYLEDKSQPIPKFKHEEHIIQNALYGRFTAFDILCETCGGKLSKSVDTEFVKLFDLFTTPIRHILASKDHGRKNSKTLTGYIKNSKGKKIEVQVREGKIVPKKPDYDYDENTHTVKIYTTTKVFKSYQELALKELKQKGINTSSIKIKLIDHIDDYKELGIPFSEGIKNFNLKMKLGLNKIATGFAASKGIQRNDMPCTIDAEKEEIIFTSNVCPFFPFGTLDLLIEPIRSVIEEGFPTHTLMLYTDKSFGKTKLVCYIDLFSTFQFFVILNHDYQGKEINETYYQTIIKQEKPYINIRQTRWKHLGLIADYLGIDKEEIKDLSIDELYNFLENKYKQYTVKYTLDINDFVHKASSIIGRNLALRNVPNALQYLGDTEREIIEATPELDADDLLSLYHEFQRIENEIPETFYKKEFIELDDNKTPFLYSTLMRMIELNNAKFSGLKTHGHSKFFLLHQFVNSNSKEEK